MEAKEKDILQLSRHWIGIPELKNGVLILKEVKSAGNRLLTIKGVYFIAGEQIIATTFQGAITWTFSGDYSGFDNNYPVISNRTLFYVSAKTIYALDIESGLCIWKKENVTKKISIPLLYNGKVYLGGGSGVVFCLDANSGKEIWKSTLPYGVIIQNQPAVYNNTLLIIHNIVHDSSDFHLFFLDPESGSILADKKLPEQESFIEPILVNGDRLLIQSTKTNPDDRNYNYVILRSVEIGLK